MSDEKKAFLGIDEMLSADDVVYREIEVPEWKTKDGKPGVIRVGSLSAEDMVEWVEANNGPAKKTAAIRILVASLVDDKGNRIGTPKHIEAFKKKNTVVVDRIVKQILVLNGLLPEEEAERKNALSEAAIAASPTV